MANVNWAGLVIMLLTINILLFVGGVRVVGTDTSDFLGRFVDVDSYNVNNTLGVTGEFEDTIPGQFQESGSGGLFAFIDTLGAVADFVIFMVNIIFTPLGLFTGLGLPVEVGLMVGLPLVFGLIFGLIYFIRSGN